MKVAHFLILFIFFAGLVGCKALSNAKLMACDHGGLIVSNKNMGEVAELQLGVPKKPIRYSELRIIMNGTSYAWDQAIKREGVRLDAVGAWSCNLVSRSYGEWGQIEGIQGYYFHDLRVHLYVAGGQVYGIRLHDPPQRWKDGYGIILDGQDLKDLSIEGAKKLFGDKAEFETSYVLWRMG